MAGKKSNKNISKTSSTETCECRKTAVKKESITGKYIFDKKLNKVVKVSDNIPSIKKTGGGDFDSPCSSGECGMDPGACMPGGCGGGCGGFGEDM